MLSSCCRVNSQDDLCVLDYTRVTIRRPQKPLSLFVGVRKCVLCLNGQGKLDNTLVHLTFLLNYLLKDSKSRQNRVRLYPQSILA